MGTVLETIKKTIAVRHMGAFAIVLWLIVVALLLLLFHDSFHLLSASVKIITSLLVIAIGTHHACKNGWNGRCVFYVIILCLLLLLIIYSIIDFTFHTLMVDVTFTYLVSVSLRVLSEFACFICILLNYKSNVSLQRSFVIVGLLIGCSYMLLITPLSVPDENYHYNSSYLVSNYLMFKNDKQEVTKQHANFDGFVVHDNVSSAYNRFTDSMFLTQEDLKETDRIVERYSLDYPIQHVPQAIGISVARLCRLNFVGVFYLGRLFNLLFYLLCSYFAIKCIPFFKGALFFIGLLPMSMQQAASLSSDSFINGLSFLIIALVCKIIMTEKKIDYKDIIAIIVAIILLSPAKVIYFLLATMLLIIPAERFNNHKERIIFNITAVGTGIFAILLTRLNALANMAQQHTSVDTWNNERYYSISDFFADPQSAVDIFLKTFDMKGFSYFENMLGSELSGFTIILPGWIVFILTISFLMNAIKQPNDGYVFRGRDRAFISIIVLSIVVLVMTSMLLGWTTINFDYIVGVQGRYFIPIALLVLLALRNNTINSTIDLEEYLLTMLFATHFFIATNIIEYTF